MTSTTTAPLTSWPLARTDRRAAALAGVDSIRDELVIGAIESESGRRLSDRSIAALRQSRVLGIMTPDDLGGNVVDAVTAFEVIEKIGHIDPATAWTATILLEGAGELATVVSQDTARRIFAGGIALKAASLKPGSAQRVDGGYVVSGRWDFVSGLYHADYVTATFLIADEAGKPVRRAALLPRGEIEILDDWQVLGMRGTGSSSFQADHVFVADDMIYDPMAEGCRTDTPLSRLGMVPFVLQMHPGMVLGAARRALDEIVGAAPKIRRGGRINLHQPPALTELTWFQRELGELDARVRAARSLCIDTLHQVNDVIDAGDRVQLPLLDQMQTAASLAAKTSVEVVTRAFRHAGAAAILDDSLLSKLLRDLNTISAHGVMGEAGFESHAEFILGLQTDENRRMV
ncbi:acyl-CoA dehydrogenase family protein [Rhodococcus sp. T2V]|uniref:acyl-CoA dehydrogenase family protein n=1 Tax=Rhodococcus sp. T2V TaxID=3034164 RepID=UPI0023E26BA2|nr:acyl-CoA dehydrogenase family protein [Rhodococcus sp. T2V]MDF3307050.1 acyl-CoA dehydrogenase family protein [Rhodococcus sp. T2V]